MQGWRQAVPSSAAHQPEHWVQRRVKAGLDQDRYLAPWSLLTPHIQPHGGGGGGGVDGSLGTVKGLMENED